MNIKELATEFLRKTARNGIENTIDFLLRSTYESNLDENTLSNVEARLKAIGGWTAEYLAHMSHLLSRSDIHVFNSFLEAGERVGIFLPRDQAIEYYYDYIELNEPDDEDVEFYDEDDDEDE